MKKFLLGTAIAVLIAGVAAISHAQNAPPTKAQIDEMVRESNNPPPANGEYSQIQRALQALQTAKMILQHTPEDKVAHRSRALGHINVAIHELRSITMGH